MNPKLRRDLNGRLCTALLILLSAAGCGGGGGGGGSAPVFLPAGNTAPTAPVAPEPPVPETPTPEVPETPGLTPTPGAALAPDCVGLNCGAANGDTFSGHGVGLWRYANTGTDVVNLPVSIQGVDGRWISLIYTNANDAPVAMPDLPLLQPAVAARLKPATRQAAANRPDRTNTLPRMVRDFDPRTHLSSPPSTARRAPRAVAPPRKFAQGATRDWFISEPDSSITVRSATLRRKASAPDGRTINFWVEDSEYGDSKFSAAHAEQFAQRFASGDASVYAMVTGIAGAPWGAHPYGDALIAPDQEMDIVFVNFDHDRRPFGMVGYFWSLNNFPRDPNDDDLKHSNESLAFFVDTESLYLPEGGEGMQVLLNTLAHELTHMINFYQRGVRMTGLEPGAYYDFEVFLEEMSALMMEDIIGLSLDPLFHTLRDNGFPGWLHQGMDNCSLIDWNNAPGTSCFSYYVAPSFGGYLLRQYGLDFYKGLLRNGASTASLPVLDDAIRQAGGPGYAEALRRWSTMAALLPSAGSPQGFGMPLRREGGFTLPAIEGPDYAYAMTWPAAVPATLSGHALFPVLRLPAGKVYREVVPVPPGTTLSVVVQ